MLKVYRASQNLSRRVSLLTMFLVVLAGLGGIAASRAFFGSVAVVDGPSMSPNFPSGSHIYTAPISTPLARGDVVVLDDGNREYAIKRIVGMPGETVHLWRGKVFINRKMLSEPYLPRHTFTCPTERRAVFILGPDQYFVLGDNRDCSTDSRSYGPIERDQLKRRIPNLTNAVRAEFRPYTLPAPGHTLIRAL